MNDALRLLGLNALFVVAGLGAVRAIGLPLRGPWLVSAVGVAPALGLVTCAFVAAQLALLGVPVGIYVVAATALCLVALACSPIRSRVAKLGTLRPREQSRIGRLVEIGLLCGLAIFSFRLLALVSVLPLAEWDGWAIWGARAHSLFVAGTPWNPAFEDAAYRMQHLEYPILFPTIEALSFDALGRFDVALIHVEPAVLLIATAFAVWGLLRLAIAPWLAALLALAVVGLDPLVLSFRSNYADGAVAVVVSLGLLCTALWLRHRASALLIPAAAFFAAAALLKNEGLLFSLAAVVAAALACRLARRSVLPLIPVALATLLAPAPWHIFVAARGVTATSEQDFTSLANPAYLVEHADRFELASRALVSALTDQWPYPVAAGVLALLAAAASRCFALVAFVGGWAALGFGGLVASYVASTIDVEWHVATSAHRVVTTLAVGLAVSSPVLVAAAWEATPPPMPLRAWLRTARSRGLQRRPAEHR